MPRPRKPTKAHELSGAYAKNPQRRNSRAREPHVEGGLGECPQFLDTNQKVCWAEIVEQAAKGVLTRSDRVIVELAARLLTVIRYGEPTAADYTQARACLQQLGMTPAARSLVTVQEPEKHNDFAAA